MRQAFARHDRRSPRARFQRGLVVAQVAVSLVLIFSALLFVQTFRNLAAVDIGFDAERHDRRRVLGPRVAGSPADRKIAFQEQLTSEIRSVPGVAAAASSTHVPLSGATWSHFFRVPGTASERRASRFAYVSPGYFATLRIPVRSGRDFHRSGRRLDPRRVMVVNESFVRGHLAGRSPIGADHSHAAGTRLSGDDLRDHRGRRRHEVRGSAGRKLLVSRDREPGAPDRLRADRPEPQPLRVGAGHRQGGDCLAGRWPAPSGAGSSASIPASWCEFVDLRTQVREKLVGERMIAWLAGAFGMLAMAIVSSASTASSRISPSAAARNRHPAVSRLDALTDRDARAAGQPLVDGRRNRPACRSPSRRCVWHACFSRPLAD